jgi:hypothetical protein
MYKRAPPTGALNSWVTSTCDPAVGIKVGEPEVDAHPLDKAMPAKTT